MPETHNPNAFKFTKRAKAGALATLAMIGVVVAGPKIAEAHQAHQDHEDLVSNLERPDALRAYRVSDEIDHDKAVVLEAPNDMPPSAFATMVEAKPDNQWELSQQIQPQADAQNYPGLQGGEQVVVERALVSEEAVKEFGVPDLQDPPK